MRLIATASATERFYSLKPKNIKRDKNCLHRIFFPPPGQSCHLQHTGLSPWLSLALRKLLNSFPCSVFLNIRAATRIYVLQQKEWTKKSMFLKKQNHVLKEKSKQRADWGSRKGPLPYPWNEYGSPQGRNAKSILLLTVEFSLTSLCLHSILSFSNWYEGDSSYIIKLVGSSICHCHYLPVIPKMRRKGTLRKSGKNTIPQDLFWSIRCIIS